MSEQQEPHIHTLSIPIRDSEGRIIAYACLYCLEGVYV